MEKAPELTEWGFIPAGDSAGDVERQRRPLPWALFSVALLAGAVTGAAVGAAWTTIPALADTPALEVTRTQEPSEIWGEAAAQHALAGARALLAESSSPVVDDAAPAPGIKRPAEDASDNPY